VIKSSIWTLLALTGAIALGACESNDTSQSAAAPGQAQQQSAPNAMSAAGGGGGAVTELKIEELKPGNGTEATSGKQVSVHYTGWLTNVTKFDSSVDRGTPFKFQLGAGQVIQGWDKGVAGMKIGGKRKLTIPPQMGYGERGAGGVIPPNATLVFEVELLGVE
jgi:FKBP-type peptidyl-prolyl cis-trans isomerase